MAGKPIDPGVISHTFTRIAIQVGLNSVRFHDLRHTLIEGMHSDAMALLDEVLPAGLSQNNNANLTP